MRHFPALDLRWTEPPGEAHIDRLLAGIDDERPIAVEDQPGGIRIFFHDAEGRARAGAQLVVVDPSVACASVDVPDENWAERSQAALTPVHVGRFIVARDRVTADHVLRLRTNDDPSPLLIVINPSMGFGTGHHASTRLCLHLAQRVPVHGTRVLDVGTGSGVLALAAWKLGARDVVAADCDLDALQSASENLRLNGADLAIGLQHWELGTASPIVGTGRFELLFANLTGAMLERNASALVALVSPGGHLIISGFQRDEEEAVLSAFARAGAGRSERMEEDSWVACVLRTPIAG